MGAAAIAALIGVVNKTLGMMPNYEQRKRKQWYEMQLLYSQEKAKAYPDRDDDVIMELHMKIILWASAFGKESP